MSTQLKQDTNITANNYSTGTGTITKEKRGRMGKSVINCCFIGMSLPFQPWVHRSYGHWNKTGASNLITDRGHTYETPCFPERMAARRVGIIFSFGIATGEPGGIIPRAGVLNHMVSGSRGNQMSINIHPWYLTGPMLWCLLSSMVSRALFAGMPVSHGRLYSQAVSGRHHSFFRLFGLGISATTKTITMTIPEDTELQREEGRC